MGAADVLLAHAHGDAAAGLGGFTFLALLVVLLAGGAALGHVGDGPRAPGAARPDAGTPAWLLPARAAPSPAPAALRERTRRCAAAVLLAGAALVHLVVVPEHLREHLTHGLFFVVLAVVQAGLAVALLRRPSGQVLRLAVDLQLWVLLLWLLTRTLGVALVTGREPVGALDLLCGLLELGVVGCLAARPARSTAPQGSAAA